MSLRRAYHAMKSAAGTAMMREIAARAGNFRGVCPIIGRLRMSYRGVDRLAMDKYRPFVPVFSMSGNDTHGYAVRTSRRTE